jgi:hypothetical protein
MTGTKVAAWHQQSDPRPLDRPDPHSVGDPRTCSSEALFQVPTKNTETPDVEFVPEVIVETHCSSSQILKEL